MYFSHKSGNLLYDISQYVKCFVLLLPKQAIRVLGLLGALDPYKHKVNIGMIDQSRDASAVSLSESKSSQDSGRPADPFHHSQFREYFVTAFMDSAILVSKFLHLTVAVPSGALLLFPSASPDDGWQFDTAKSVALILWRRSAKALVPLLKGSGKFA